MNPKLKNALKIVLFGTIGLLFLWLALKDQDLSEMWQIMISANYSWVIISLFVAFLSHYSRAVRWKILLNSMGYKVNSMTAFYSVMIGYFTNYGVPRSGELVRCTMMNRAEKVPVDKLIGTVVLERIFDLIMLALCVVLMFLTTGDVIANYFADFLDEYIFSKFKSANRLIFVALAVMAAGGGFIIWLFKSPRFAENKIISKARELFYGFMDGIRTVFRMKQSGLFLFHTLAIWFCYYLMSTLCLKAVPATAILDWGEALFVYIMGAIGMTVPAPGGTGSYQFFIVKGMSEVLATPKDQALAFANVVFAAQFIFNVLLGILSFLMITRTIKRNNAVQAQANQG